MGLITCKLDEDDRRCTRVALTAQGRRELAEIRLKRTQYIERRLQMMSANDQRLVRDAANILEKLLGD